MPNACNGRIWTDAKDGTFLSMRTKHSCREGREDTDEADSHGDGTGPMTQSATAIVKVEAGDSLTNAILGILPQQSADDAEAGSSGKRTNAFSGTSPARDGPATADDLFRDGCRVGGRKCHRRGGQQSTIGQPMVRNLPPATVRTANFAQNYSQSLVNSQHPTVANNCHSEQHFAGRKRRAFPPPPQSSALPLNGFSNCVGEDGETVELRLKRLKCELIEKQLMELGHQEEWRLKQEFLLGRQTAAMENIVIQLRQIKEKLK
ncbi:hypothetical protein niasHT_006417 [Heterodera trifolii]|uniref:Uncharacterized protein n=1 Tax=Heterodera trifolii TaxID=157864 RepID=A0ABD2M688_9BILA